MCELSCVMLFSRTDYSVAHVRPKPARHQCKDTLSKRPINPSAKKVPYDNKNSRWYNITNAVINYITKGSAKFKQFERGFKQLFYTLGQDTPWQSKNIRIQ